MEPIRSRKYDSYLLYADSSHPWMRFMRRLGYFLCIFVFGFFVFLWSDSATSPTESVAITEFEVRVEGDGKYTSAALVSQENSAWQYHFMQLPDSTELTCLNNAALSREGITFYLTKTPIFWPFRDSAAISGDMAIVGWSGIACKKDSSGILQLISDFTRAGPIIIALVLIAIASSIFSWLAGQILKITGGLLSEILLIMAVGFAGVFWFLSSSLLVIILITPITIIFASL